MAAKDAVCDLIGKELCELFEAFPPAESDVAWEDAALARRFAGRLAELPRADRAIVDDVAQLCSWDLRHEIDAIDHYQRNVAAAAPPLRKDATYLLWRVALEHLLSRKDECRGLLTSADLVDVIERARRRFGARAAAIH